MRLDAEMLASASTGGYRCPKELGVTWIKFTVILNSDKCDFRLIRENLDMLNLPEDVYRESNVSAGLQRIAVSTRRRLGT